MPRSKLRLASKIRLRWDENSAVLEKYNSRKKHVISTETNPYGHTAQKTGWEGRKHYQGASLHSLLLNLSREDERMLPGIEIGPMVAHNAAYYEAVNGSLSKDEKKKENARRVLSFLDKYKDKH